MITWLQRARESDLPYLRFMYHHRQQLGASAAELQEIAWVTYLGNVYTEEKIT